MAENNTPEENEETSEYVTRTELENILDTKLEDIVSQLLGDTVTDGTGEEKETFEETTDDIDDVVGHLSPSQIEQMMEKKVQEALAQLGAKKETREVAKKTTAKKTAPVKKETPKVEVEEEAPSVPGKMSLGQRLWGTK